MIVSSQPVAGVAIGDRGHEEAEAEGQHDHVHHGISLPKTVPRTPTSAISALTRINLQRAFPRRRLGSLFGEIKLTGVNSGKTFLSL
jgi:hypothetical protein